MGQAARSPVILLVLVLAAWFSTVPLGVGLDSDFHQASVWCASGIKNGKCEKGSRELTRRVPKEVLDTCPQLRSTGVCLQTRTPRSESLTETDRVNLQDRYPSVYYRVSSLLISDNANWSIFRIRLLNVAAFVLVVSAALSLATSRVRRALAIAFGLTAPAYLWIVVPITNQSWTVSGLAGFWAFALVFEETTSWAERRRRFAVVGMTLCTLLVVSSRTDGVALLLVSAMICLGASLVRRGVALTRLALVIAGIGIFGFFLLRLVISPHFFRYFVSVFSGRFDGYVKYDFSFGELLFHNVHHSAEFVMHSLAGQHVTNGDPLAVGPTIFLVAIGLGGLAFLVAGRPTGSFVVALVGVTAALVVYPVLATVRNGQTFTQEFVPRYLAPFAIPAVGLLLVLAPNADRLHGLSRSARRLLVGIVAVAHGSALHIAMRRAVTGDNLGVSTWNLNEWVLWWWPIGPTPMTMWLLGSLALPVFVNAQLKEPVDA